MDKASGVADNTSYVNERGLAGIHAGFSQHDCAKTSVLALQRSALFAQVKE